MKFLKYIIYSLFFSFALFSCNTAINTETKEEESHEEESSTVTELSLDQMKAVGMELGAVEMRNIANTEKINGFLRVPNSNKAVVTAIFAGIINSVRIQEGDYVKKGQIIATLSNPDYISTQEQYLLIKNQITYAEQEHARQQELFDNGAGAKKNLQNAIVQLKDLRTQQASLVKRLQLMGIKAASVTNENIKNGLSIVAPMSGVIGSITAQIGSYVDVSSPVAEIIDNSAIHLDLQVFEKDMASIKLNQIVDFTLTNRPDKLYKAKVYKIGSSFLNDSKTISVHCHIEGDKSGLIDGMSAVGMISLSSDLTMAVPSSAIVDADGKFYVFIKTDKKIEDHKHEGEDAHVHSHDENEIAHETGSINFEKVEIQKGATDLGYTAIVPVIELPQNTVIVTKGAFFVNAKMSNTGGHEH